MYNVKPAIDWIWYLGVFDEFRDRVAALLQHPQTAGDANHDWIEQLLARPPLAWHPVDGY